MTTAAKPRKSKRPRKKAGPKFGMESNGILMTPEEFDRADPADFDECWDFELINGVLIVSPIPLEQEADPNEELGYLLRDYRDSHPQGAALDATLPERYVKTGENRRKADRLIWAGLGRLPKNGENPTIIVEFVSKRKRDRERDYEAKRSEYQAIAVQEYWIFDRFEKTMTVYTLENGDYRKRVLRGKQHFRTPLLPGFNLPIARLFKIADQWDQGQNEEPI